MTLNEIQDLLYQLLHNIDDVFAKLDVKYYLAYGSLLGAKRHSGIIPWDDDVDIFVLRQDYLHLCENYNSTASDSFLFSMETSNEYFLPFAKIGLNSTQSISKLVNCPKELGVSIDIFPLDTLPDGKLLQEIYFYISKFVNRCIGTYHYNPSDLKNNKSLLLWGLSHILGYSRLTRMSKSIYQRLLKIGGSEKIGNIVWGSYHHKDVFPARWLGKSDRMLEFGNNNYKVPEMTEELLKHWYLDYMKFPSSEEIEKASHHFNDLYEKI